MLVPDGSSSFEIIIKKSRFIAEACRSESPEEARNLLKQKRLEHPDAAHVVHAFIAGESAQYMGMSDDGEPSGTSGKPVLEILKGRGITNIMLTVVRYFGGTKLGTGGLVRAYSDAAAGCLDGLKTLQLVKYREFSISVDYHLYQPLKTVLLGCGCRIGNESFGTGVDIDGWVPEDKANLMKDEVVELSSGRAEIIVSSDTLLI